MANPSLSEYLAQSQRGLYQNIFGGEYVKKADAFFTVDGAGSGIFDVTYGRKVWQALNNQTRFFNAIPRVVWGNTAGWRIRSARTSGINVSRSLPVTETGTLPEVDISDIQTVNSLPRIVATTFGASVKSVFTAQLEGGVGDVLALENENAQLDHVKEIQEELLAGSGYLLKATSNNSTFTVASAKIAKYFKVGDTVSSTNDAGADENVAGIKVLSHSAGAVTTAAASQDFDNNGVVSVYARAGFTSLDDIVSVNDFDRGGSGIIGYANTRAYNLTHNTGRVAGDWDAAATVQGNAGVGRDLSLTHLDTCIQKIRENGGEPKLILMGHDQYFKLERLLNSQQRYMGQEEYQVGIGSERTFPGTRVGLVLATYQGIPIMPDADVAVSSDTSDNQLGSNVYVLDTDYIETAIAQPTQYVENRDFFAADKLVVRGLLYTMGELRCKNFFVQAKITDLNT